MVPLYRQVALARDADEHGLRRVEVATLVDRVPDPERGEAGVVIEVLNALGESIKTNAVAESGIEPLQADEVLAVRSFVNARRPARSTRRRKALNRGCLTLDSFGATIDAAGPRR